MEVAKSLQDLKNKINGYKRNLERIAFVPTMGYLHEGHISLVEIAKSKGSKVVVSIFVNPTQFNDPKDFEKYPIDLDRDFAMLRAAGVDLIFTPTKEEIYPPGFESWVELSEIVQPLEGGKRPGHFKGVTTIVSILFNLVEPNVAIFGEKDFQQVRVIETMVRDLRMNIEIVRGKTKREADGLAMSSRNARLTSSARELAPKLNQALRAMVDAFKAGKSSAAEIQQIGLSVLKDPQIDLEYLEIVDEVNLKETATVTDKSRFLVAANIGGVRLIDNIGL
jgi:pantoate--beta-alanine ligase